MTQSSPPTCSWRPGDAEALRIALSIPVTSAALAALTPAEVNTPVRTKRKGVAGGVVPNPLPLSKLAVVDYTTERAPAGGDRHRVEPRGSVTGGGAEPAEKPAHRPAGAAAAKAAELAPVQPRPLPGIAGAG
jgi:hypothetical protein